MKKTNIIIPTALIDKINFYIKSNSIFTTLSIKNQNKLRKCLIELWYFIYNKQTKIKKYTSLYKKDLEHFRIVLNKQEYKHSKLLNMLKDCDIIIINNKYSKGSFSKSYKVITEFINKTQTFTEVELDFTKIYKDIKSKEYWLNKYPSYSKQIEDVYNTKVDLDKLITYFNNNINKRLKDKVHPKKGYIIHRYLDINRINKYIQRALKINFNNIWFKVTDYGRFYTSITNLTTEADDYLTLYDEEIFELDVANCQPLLLCLFVNHIAYQKDCEKGIFYNIMADYMNMDRNEFKLLCFRKILFSNNLLKKDTYLYQCLEEVYPGLIEQINCIKQNTKLHTLLHKAESDIFVKTLSSLSHIRSITKHDAIFVTYRNIEMMRELIKNEFKNKGLEVTLK